MLIVAPCHNKTGSQVGHLWTPKLKRQMQTVDKKANIFQTTTLTAVQVVGVRDVRTRLNSRARSSDTGT